MRLGNKKFLRTAGKFAAALRLLEAVGFGARRSAEATSARWKRTDAGAFVAGGRRLLTS